MTIKINVREVAPEMLEVARRMYKSYAANCDGKTFDGRPMPAWEGLNDAVRSHWCAAATEGVRYSTELIGAELERSDVGKLANAAIAQAKADVDTQREIARDRSTERDFERARAQAAEKELAELRATLTNTAMPMFSGEVVRTVRAATGTTLAPSLPQFSDDDVIGGVRVGDIASPK